ncbi:MAG: response regulator [Thermodesulfobacteriota bacterium]
MQPNESAATIVVVHDDPHLLAFVVNVLKPFHIEVVGIESRVACLSRCRTKPPDVLVLDLMMPDDEGMHLYRQLCADPELSRIPVILISAIDRDLFFSYHQFACSKSPHALPQPRAYFEKPVEAEELISCIHSLIPERMVS